MKKILPVLVLAFFPLALTIGQAVQATKLSNWHDDNQVVVPWLNGRYNEVWGFAVNNHEFAVLGSTGGMHFIDVTAPVNPQQVAFIPGASAGNYLVHRDFKDFKGYLYCVADEGSTSTLQIIDIQNLPNNVTQVYSSNEFVITAHNLFIDTSQAKLYLLGAQGLTKILDISNPTQPVLKGSYPNGSFYMPYVHDAYIRDNIGIMNCGGDGLWIIDFSNPASPVLLGTMTSYPGAGYNHSGWLSEDGAYYYLLDETHGSPVKVVDMSDYGNLQVVAAVDAESSFTQIPHNALIQDNMLYVSYYYDGLQVFDISNPLNPQRVAYYDTYPGPDAAFFAGAWGVYPLLPSGNILISDIQSGLWVFGALNPLEDLTFVATETKFDICAGETISFNLIVGSDFSADGVTLEVAPGSIAGNVQFSQNPALAGSTVTVTVAGLSSTTGQPAGLTILASDGEHSKSVNLEIKVSGIPTGANPLSPAPNAVNVPVKSTFEWSDDPEAESYKMQISSNLANFNSGIVYSATTSASSFTLSTPLSAGTTYAWRVTAKNKCGETISTMQTFTTEGLNAADELLENSLTISPNPASDWLTLSFGQPVRANDFVVEMTGLSGQQVMNRQFSTGETFLRINVADQPSGIYLLKITSGGESAVVRKVVIQH